MASAVYLIKNVLSCTRSFLEKDFAYTGIFLV